MAIGDVYQLKDFQAYAGQTVLNVYYYMMTAGTGGAPELITAYALDVLPEVLDIQSDLVSHVTLEAINLDSDVDWSESSSFTPNTGTRVGADSPPFLASGYRLIRTSRNTRHGYKRYAGVIEEVVDQNGYVSGAWDTYWDALETALAADIDDTLGNTYKPIIVRRNSLGVVTATNDVSQAHFYGITTQNTRKWGRGV